MKKNFVKRSIVLLLSMVMALTYMPAMAFAAVSGENVTEKPESAEGVNETVEEASESEDTEADVAETPVDASTDEEASTAEATDAADNNDDSAEDPAGDAASVDTTEDEEAAAADSTEETLTVERTDISGSMDTTSDVSIDSNDDLLMQYLENQVSRELSSEEESANKPIRLKASRATRGSRLTDNNAYIYKLLADYISQIASGDITDSGSFSVKTSDLDFTPKQYYRAKDLGVSKLFKSEKTLTDEAFKAILDVLGYNSSDVINALLADHPYELYWYDKVAGNTTSVTEINMVTLTYPDGSKEKAIQLDEAVLSVKFVVTPKYRTDEKDETKIYSINADKVASANDAAQNAKDIISDNYEKDVIDCLNAYCTRILELNTYNDEAAAEPPNVYGDPWQMIYVFDGDPGTNAVCEGYSKAFQFLMDNTSRLSNKGIECFSVLGKMNEPGKESENHMWNIVAMGDGEYYLADLTNCDEGTIGAPDKLFLKGCMPGGSPEDGYDFDILDPNNDNNDKDGISDLHYSYNESTLSSYDRELYLSEDDYAPSEGVQIVAMKLIKKSGNLQLRAGKDGFNDTKSGFFRYGYDLNLSKMFEDGDILRVTFSDSDVIDYTYYEKDAGYGPKRFVHDLHTADHKFLYYEYYDFEFSSNQKSKWTAGGTGYKFYLTHIGTDPSVKAVIPIKIVKTPGVAPTGKVAIKKIATNLTNKTITIVWDKSKVKGANSYQIVWRVRGTKKWSSKSVGNTDRGTITGLKAGYLYEINVRPYAKATATTATACGAWSKLVRRYFHAPVNLKARSKAKKTFTVNWKANSKATSFQVFYTTNKSGKGMTKNVVLARKGSTGITIKSIKANGKAYALRSGRTYYVRVRELRKVGNVTYIGNYSPIIAVKVK